jgi:hypothetical protein
VSSFEIRIWHKHSNAPKFVGKNSVDKKEKHENGGCPK